MLSANYNNSLKLFCPFEAPSSLYFTDTAAWVPVVQPFFPYEHMCVCVCVINILRKLIVHISLILACDVHIHSVMYGVQVWVRREIKWSELAHNSFDTSTLVFPY